MFSFDIECLDLDSTAGILSLGCVYHNGTSDVTYQGLIDTGIFIKFDVQDQIKRFKRTTCKSTLDWWKKQSHDAQVTNLIPHADDLDTETGMQLLRTWFTSKPDHKNEIVWARGGLDQMCLESLMRAINMDPFIYYASWRDTRTAIECFYPKSKNGYVQVDPNKIAGYERTQVLKHHPLHDSANDLCQLLGGVE